MTEQPSSDGTGESTARSYASRRDVLKLTGAGLASATALGTVGSASAADSGIPTPWLHREGNEIRDPTDSQVILRGVNIPDPKRLATTVPARGKNWNHIIEHATDAERDWHANVVRVPVQPGDIAELAPIPTTDKEFYEPGQFSRDELVEYCETYLDPVVEFCRQRGVYCIVDYHRHWGKMRWFREDLDAELRMFWNVVAPRYADQPHVIYEVYNEPTLPGMYIDSWYNAKYAGVWRRWKKVAQPWVNIVREHAPENLIVIGSPGWSSQPEGAGIEEFDGENLMYTYHIYPGHGITTPEGFDSRGEIEEGTNAVWEDVPLFMTEFGWEPGAGRWIGGKTSAFGEGVTQWADERPVHWTAWCFDTAWLPSMFDRAFVDGDDVDDAVGNPYEGSIPERCPDPPCEWDLLGRDAGTSEYMGEYIRQLLADRKDDDLPTIDHDDQPPAAPENVTVDAVGSDAAEIAWSGVTDTGGSGLDHYEVTLDGEAWPYVRGGGTETTATVENLVAGTTHEIGVRAVDTYGNVGETATVTVETETGDADPVGPPQNLGLADRTHRSIELTWESGAGDAARYVITVDGEEYDRIPAPMEPVLPSYRLDDLALDSEHTVDIATIGRGGDRSEPVTATVRPQPAHATESDVLINDFEGTEPLTNNALDAWVGGGAISGVENGIAQFEWDGIDYHGTTADLDASETPLLKVKARGEMGYELSSLALSVEGSFDKQPVGDITDDRIDTDWSVVTIDLEAADAGLAPLGQLQFDTVWGTAGAFEIDELWLAAPDDPSDGIDSDTTAPSLDPIDGTVPRDLDGDGVHEDLSGDGALNFPDVNTLFQNLDEPTVQNHVSAYDFTGDGLVDQQDVLALFEMV